MSTLEAIILGIIQGITELLPVSSSGHLILAREMFGLFENLGPDEKLAFDVLVHFGTLIVIAFAFRKEIVSLLKGRKKVWLALFIGSIPAGLAGVTLKLLFKNSDEFFPIWVIGIAYLFLGAFLLLGERKMKDEICMDDLTPVQSFLIGIAQAIAILPGISRSGSTIITGGLLGLKREEAMAFSFLMAIIAVGGATLIEMKDITQLGQVNFFPLAAGFTASIISGFASIWVLKKIVRNKKLAWFGPYCLLLGVVAIAKAIIG